MKRYSVFAVALCSLLFGVEAGVSQPAGSKECPAATTGKAAGNSAENPASVQGIEHSAILPDAEGHGDSAAPTVKKDGAEVAANTDCPKEPNRLETPTPGSHDGGRPNSAR
jgi:hypothetical protein